MQRPHITVEDLMTTSIVALRATDPIAKAVSDMHIIEVHHFPVIDDQDRVIGIVSDRDLLRALASGGGQPDPVGTVMTKAVRTIAPSQDAAMALDMMLELRISALPVVNERGGLIGIVTSRDFLELAARVLHGRPPGRD
jgi:acetoin utilization protein AcuB